MKYGTIDLPEYEWTNRREWLLTYIDAVKSGMYGNVPTNHYTHKDEQELIAMGAWGNADYSKRGDQPGAAY